MRVADRSGRHFHVSAFAGVERAETGFRFLGDALTFDDLPKRETRRLSDQERGVISCVLGLVGDAAQVPMVLGSRYGTFAHVVSLLKDIIGGEVVSPTRFSLSVHNAPVGIASQITGNHAGYTAVAAGRESLRACAMECLAQLSDGAGRLLLVFSDWRLPDEYAPFDEARDDIQFACMIEPAGTAVADESPDLESLLSAADARQALSALAAHFGGAAS